MTQRGDDNLESLDAAQLAPRVKSVEHEISTIRSQIGALQGHVDRGFDKVATLVAEQQQRTASELKDRDARLERAFAQINSKFDDESKSRHTNWSVVIAAVTLVVVIVGAIGSAWVLPLAKADKTHEEALIQHTKSIDEMREREAKLREDLARLDERSKFAVYVGGVKPTKESP